MDQKWFISSIFGIFCFLSISNFFLVTSHTLSNSGSVYNDIDSDVWESNKDHFPVLQEDFPNNFREANRDLTEQPSVKDVEENKRWLNVLTFDKHYNLTETDKGPQNTTKNIFINTEEHLKIFEKEDEEVEDESKINSQLQEGEEKNVFHLLSPEGFLSQVISQDQSRALERIKRQAEEGENGSEKKRCRCRRKRRRGMRRRRMRRRRNRTGQERPARRRRRRRGRRRNGRRRGRRRCVCRKRGDGEGNSENEEGKSGDGEEPEVEEADGEEEGTTEGGEETAAEGDGEEGDGGEGGGDGGEGGGDEGEGGGDGDEGGEQEGEEENYEEEYDEDEEDDEESSSVPEGEMPSLNNVPTYVFPYPNMIETPIALMPVGIPIGSSRSTAPVHKIPSYLAVGALLSGNSNSDTEDKIQNNP